MVPRPNFRSGVRIGGEGLNPYVDTVIEVIDPATGRLVATRRLTNLHLRGFWSGDLLTSASIDKDDNPYLDIWQVQLKRP
jgi:hypothetical protein